MFVNRLNFNSQELASKYFLRFRMRNTSLPFPNSIKNHTRKFQIISNYTKPIVLCAINFSLKKNGKSNMSRIEVVNLGGHKYSYRNLEMGEH